MNHNNPILSDSPSQPIFFEKFLFEKKQRYSSQIFSQGALHKSYKSKCDTIYITVNAVEDISSFIMFLLSWLWEKMFWPIKDHLRLLRNV